MSIRFAAARPATVAHFATRPRRIGAFRAANDNAAEIANPELLRAALMHFASHGLGAAQAARDEAGAALARQDAPAARHWIEICRTFDRRMATGLLNEPGFNHLVTQAS
jgi:hypothetical protein